MVTVKHFLAVVVSLFSVIFCPVGGFTVTIHPQLVSQNGRARFETDRWNAHNGLDAPQFITGNNVIGTRAARWINSDLFGGLFPNAREDPNRRGYADPSYFQNPSLQRMLCSMYLADLASYQNRNTVIEIKGQFWPKWLNTSEHGGVFPNNLDAAAEMVVLLQDAIFNYTKGNTPMFFEVINEPDSMWKNLDWNTVIQFHKIVAQKLHAKYPLLAVGGPTKDGAIADIDQQGFRLWEPVRDFMNMSLYHLDFMSFHPYNSFTSLGDDHHFNGINEARLVAVIDMVESYANLLRGKPVPLVLSEYGLGGVNVDPPTPASLVQWAFIFEHNSHMFTYINHRGVMEQPVAFLLSHDTYGFENGSLFYENGTEKSVTKAYRFWKNFGPADQFLRIDSPYNVLERTVSSLALVDVDSRKVKILLHNYAQNPYTVTLNFSQRWIQPSTANATCIYLGEDKTAILSVNKTTRLVRNIVNLPPEGTCVFTLSEVNIPAEMPTIREDTVYSKDIVIPIKNNTAQTEIILSNVNNLVYVRLRFAVSTSDKTAITLPFAVKINGLMVGHFYTLYDPDRVSGKTQWEVYNYQVPTSALRPGTNSIQFDFVPIVGHISTVALITGVI